MAELPKYRPLGVGVASMPAVDFVSAGRAQAGVYDALTRGLDVMSKYVAQKAEFEAAAMGQQFGAENAPTQAQMKLAQQEGEDISKLLPGDDYSVYGRSARKSALDVVVDRSEMAARQGLTALRIEADTTDMSPTLFTQKINSLIDGYSENISALNPAAGSKFRAGIATVGNSALLAHSQAMADKAEKQDEIVALAAMDVIVDQVLPDIVNGGSTFNPDTGDFVTIDDRIDLERSKIFQFGYDVGDKALITQQLKLFDKKVMELKTGAVADFVLQNPVKNTDDLLLGNQVSDPHVQDILNNMNDQERRAAIKLSIEMADQQRSRDNQVETANRRKRSDAVDDLLPQITDAKIAGNTTLLDTLLVRLRELDGSKYESIASAIHTEGGVDDAEVVAGLTVLATNRQLTFEDINTAAKNRQISSGTHLNMLSKLQSQRDKKYNTAMTYAKNELGYPVTNKMSFTSEEEIAKKQVADLENELILAIEENPAINRLDFIKNRVKEIQSTATYSSQEISQANVSVKGVATQLQKLGYPVDRDSDWQDIQSSLNKAVSDGKYDPKKAEGYKRSFTILGSQQ